jgi:TonB family protein
MDTAMAMARCNHSVEPVYPAAALAAGIEGTVWVETHIGPDGRVHQASAVSDPTELRQAAVDSVLQLTFIPLQSHYQGRPNELVGVVAQLPVEFQIPTIAEEGDPLSVSALPLSVRVDLASRGCRIPRILGNGEWDYAMSSFRSPKSKDIAVVCHRLKSKGWQVLVYSFINDAWEGEVIDASDYEYGPGESSCYWSVAPSTPKEVHEGAMDSDPVDGSPLPINSEDRKFLASLSHDAVGVNNCDIQETYYYFDGRRWHAIVGGLE